MGKHGKNYSTMKAIVKKLNNKSDTAFPSKKEIVFYKWFSIRGFFFQVFNKHLSLALIAVANKGHPAGWSHMLISTETFTKVEVYNPKYDLNASEHTVD